MKTVKLFDFQSEGGSKCNTEAAALWGDLEYGNDYYYYSTTLGDLRNFGPLCTTVFVFYDNDGNMLPEEYRGHYQVELDLVHIPKYIESCGVTEDEPILIHWWW